MDFTPVKRDYRGRYLFTGKDGQEKAYTRVTTLAKVLDDTYFLDQWKLRTTIKGLAERQDLYALACATPIEDKKTLNNLAKDALAAIPSRANIGTAIHSATEAADNGRPYNLPEIYRADVRAYQKACREWGLIVRPEYIETVLACHALEVAGTTDRFVEVTAQTIELMDRGAQKMIEKGALIDLPSASLEPGDLVVLDVKTGSSVDFGASAMPVQLAVYARAEQMLDPQTQSLVEAPDVNLEFGLVMHIDAGTGESVVHVLDLIDGWRGAHLAKSLMEWQEGSNVRSQLRLWKGTGSVHGSRFRADEETPLTDLINRTTTVAEMRELFVAEQARFTPQMVEYGKSHIATLK
jgi:hypothetical protein